MKWRTKYLKGYKMGIKFGDSQGEAKKGGNFMKLEEGTNRFRMVGEICPRYQYWVKQGTTSRAFECLSFDREEERFTNLEKDWVTDLVPMQGDKKTQCQWAYAVQVIDRKDGKLKILNLKKKMFAAIKTLAGKVSRDPTDLETGFDIIVDRVKTGPLAYNVEYQLDQFGMMDTMSETLSAEDLELLKELKSIDEVVPRPTPDEQKKELEALLSGGKPEAPKVDKEAINELGD